MEHLYLFIIFFFLFLKGFFCLGPITYESCAPKSCGDGLEIRFPFHIEGLQPWNCGYRGFGVYCNNNRTFLNQTSVNNYLVKEMNYTPTTMLLVNAQNTTCPSALTNMTFDPERYQLDPNRHEPDGQELVFLMNCSMEIPQKLRRYMIGSCNPDIVLVMLSSDGNLRIGKEVCGHVVVVPVEGPVGEVVDAGNYVELMLRGFTMEWLAPTCYTCEFSGGRCASSANMLNVGCLCPNTVAFDVSCPFETAQGPVGTQRNGTKQTAEGPVGTPKSGTKQTTEGPMDMHKNGTKRRVFKATLSAGVVVILIVIVLCFLWKLKRRRKTKNHVDVETFLKNHAFLAPKRYSYQHIKKMTTSFKTILGKGGFGSVYRGVLSNGTLVAVKVLSELKGNGEDFLNEVASVGRTSHVNIVSLVGFCCEGRQRALIYEFMPNGSLEKFIYDQASSNCKLGWKKLHQIAIGIARGLEYLHSGCNTRILHFDIKPHNILLDKELIPKISDFGLAKLFPEERSMLSMSHMRGTPGYIAPELFSRNFGQVSHKSDVYSYGMMILEMVGGRKNIEVEVDHTSEIYFPHWIYKKVELHEEVLHLHGIMSDEENEMAKKMIIVGLWCIQTNPLSRPTITKVLEMLEGDLELLEIPPKPYLSSPPRSVESSSTQ